MFALPPSALAAVFHGPGRPMTLDRFSLPELQEGEALVRIRCATLCGSDLHTYFGRRNGPAPSILGHEMVGEIAALGGGVTDFDGTALRVGDRVTWSMVWSCGRCFFCSRGRRPKCERLFKFGHEAIAPGHELTGGMAEYCHLQAGTSIFRVPNSIPDTVASPANCATATVAAVLRTTGPLAGETVVILGAGMLGLTACAMAGAAQTVVIEPDARRRDWAPRFGADHAIDSGRSDTEVSAMVSKLTEGRGADAVLEVSGQPDAVERGASLLRIGGRMILAGSVFPSRPVQFAAEQLVRRLIRIEGVHNYNPEDLAAALRFLGESRRPFAELVAVSFPLAEAERAIAYAEQQRPPRVALLP